MGHRKARGNNPGPFYWQKNLKVYYLQNLFNHYIRLRSAAVYKI